MGKLYDSPLEGSSGRTGRYVVANVGGVEILRRRPKSKNKEVKAKQLLIRQRFKEFISFLSGYKHYAKEFYGKPVKNVSRYSQASANVLVSYILDYTNNSFTIDNANIMFSKGNILAPYAIGVTTPGTNQIKVDWNDNSGGSAERETDQAQILIGIDQVSKTFLFENVASRLDATCTLTVPPEFQNKTLAVWLAFRDVDRKNASDSTFLGTVTL